MSKFLLFNSKFDTTNLDTNKKASICDKVIKYFKQNYGHNFTIEYPQLEDKLFVSSKNETDLFKIPNTLKISDKIHFERINIHFSNNDIGTGLEKANKEKFEHFFEGKNFKLVIERGNLLNQKVNVIVNAANTMLRLGGGVAGAILDRCGSSVQHECSMYLKYRNKEMEIGEVMHTGSYGKINAKFIIHACGPRWNDYNIKEDCIEDLKLTFYNTLIYMENKLNAEKSIAIPLISSGVFAVPKEKCCQALHEAIEKYLQESDDKIRNLSLIKIVNIDNETNDAILDYFIKNPFNSENITANDVNSKTDYQDENNNAENSKCLICKNSYPLKDLEKSNCCFYCIDCYPNYEQNNKICLCKSF